jgi:hypothetical protein
MHPLYADSGTRTSPLEEIRRSIEVLYRAGDVAELRAFGKRKTYAGWFDDHDQLVEHIAELDAKGFDCYVTMNPKRSTPLRLSSKTTAGCASRRLRPAGVRLPGYGCIRA